MRLIDTHTHLDFADFDADRPRLLANAASRGVERMVVLGVYQDNFQRVWDLACANEGVYAALGLHPIYLEQHLPEHLAQLRDWLERLRGNPRLCAVGEFGLDFYLPELDPTRQQARAVGVEIGEVEVGVGVDQAHAQALAIRCLKVRPMACTPGS